MRMPSGPKRELKSVNSAIELDGVGWRAGKSFALRDLSVRVPAGSIYGFLGPNGSGKTTTIRIFMGMMKPDRGDIRVLGMTVPRDMPRILARVGYVPERPHTYPALTVGEQVRFHSSFFKLWDQGWADELLERLGLDPGRKIARMSKGVDAPTVKFGAWSPDIKGDARSDEFFAQVAARSMLPI